MRGRGSSISKKTLYTIGESKLASLTNWRYIKVRVSYCELLQKNQKILKTSMRASGSLAVTKKIGLVLNKRKHFRCFLRSAMDFNCCRSRLKTWKSVKSIQFDHSMTRQNLPENKPQKCFLGMSLPIMASEGKLKWTSAAGCQVQLRRMEAWKRDKMLWKILARCLTLLCDSLPLKTMKSRRK